MQNLINDTSEKENVLKNGNMNKKLYIKKRLKYNTIKCHSVGYCRGALACGSGGAATFLASSVLAC